MSGELLREFELWLRRKGVSERTIRDYLSGVRRYWLSWRECGHLPRQAAAGLRNYAHFLYEMGYIGEDEHARLCRALKIRRSGADARVVRDDEVRAALARIDREDVRTVYEILVYSGCRLSEAISLLSRFDPGRWVSLGEYGRYALFSARGAKRAYWLYLPGELLERVRALQPISLSQKAISRYAERHGLLRPKYVRKWWYQVAYEAVKDRELIDFMQGRARISVGSRHYDVLLEKADKEYARILEEIRRRVLESQRAD